MGSGDGVLTISGTGEMNNWGMYMINGRYFFSYPGWREYNQKIKSVVVTEGVTTIGNSAFNEYRELTSVSFPNTLKSIGESSFELCLGLKSIEIPGSVETIGNSAFNMRSYVMYEDRPLTEIIFNEGLKTIGQQAFHGVAIPELVLPSTVTSIGDSAFAMALCLEKITLPEGLNWIGDSAFYRTPLTEVRIPSTVAHIGAEAFYYCTELKSVELPEGDLNSLSSNVFYGTQIESITIPEGTTVVYQHCFSGCEKLTTVYLPASLTYFHPNAVEESAVTTIYFAGTAEAWNEILAEAMPAGIGVYFGTDE